MGPFDKGQVTGMMTGGLVEPGDLGWHQGLTEWQPLQILLELPPPVPVPSTPPPASTHSSTAMKPDGPSGVGGWLTFFCVGLTILGPLNTLAQMNAQWTQAIKFPALHNALYWETGCLSAMTAYGFIVGCAIWRGSAKGRNLAKQFLSIQLVGYFFIEVVALSMLPIPVQSSAQTEVVSGTIARIIYFLVWWFYFKKSKRVRNTYGEE